MSRIIYIGISILSVLILCSACQKEDLPTYNGEEKINLSLSAMSLKKDSVEVAFGFTTEVYKTLTLELIVIGYPKDYAREIALKVEGDADLTKELLELPDKIELPANAMKLSVPCKIHKNSQYIGEGKSFTLRIVDSKDLKTGLTSSLWVNVTDDIPTTWVGDAEMFWGMLESTYFGECSKTKYLFVYKYTGEWDFNNWKGGWGGDHNKARAANSVLNRELAAYEKENGPLVDPDKGQVTFPKL